MSEPELHEAEHFRKYAPETDGVKGRLELEAKEKDIPIIGPLMGKLLYLLARGTGARRILELDTATGYSAIWMAGALGQLQRRNPDQRVKIVTIEWDANTAKVARDNIAEAGYSDIVEVQQGDARELMSALEGGEPFDMVFNDVEKEFYTGLLEPSVRLLRPGGLMVFDNTAFKSAGDFLEVSHRHPELETVHLYGFFPDHDPDFDAVTLCVKKG